MTPEFVHTRRYTVAGKNGQMTALRYARCKARRNVRPSAGVLPSVMLWICPRLPASHWLFKEPITGRQSRTKSITLPGRTPFVYSILLCKPYVVTARDAENEANTKLLFYAFPTLSVATAYTGVNDVIPYTQRIQPQRCCCHVYFSLNFQGEWGVFC